MRSLLPAIRTILTLAATVLAGLTGYLLLLTGAAVLGGGALASGRMMPPDATQRRRFALLVPAHDEESTIGRLLASTAALAYPANRYDVIVVADNCTDRTAEVARAAGGQVEERFDRTDRGKGYALRWLLARLRERGARYDAYVVIDADTVVAPDLLRRLDAHFEAGSKVVQVYYTVLNVGESPLAALRYAALAAIHYLRPLGRKQLGLSCGLKGNGMGFLAEVLEHHGWEWFTLAEDVEFHLALVADGLRVDFVPETAVLADMPVTFAQAESQNERWERGRIEMLRERGLGLLLDGLRQRDPVRLDAIAEQLIPPLSVPVVLAGATLAAGLLVRSRAASVLAGFSLGGQLVYVLTGLALVGAPWRVYRALAYAPGTWGGKCGCTDARWRRVGPAPGCGPLARPSRIQLSQQCSTNSRLEPGVKRACGLVRGCGLATAGTLTVLGLFHLLWAAGIKTGSTAALPERNGRPLFQPGRGATILVAGRAVRGSADAVGAARDGADAAASPGLCQIFGLGVLAPGDAVRSAGHRRVSVCRPVQAGARDGVRTVGHATVHAVVYRDIPRERAGGKQASRRVREQTSRRVVGRLAARGHR